MGPKRLSRRIGYVGKPFHYPELAARIDAVLRRARAAASAGYCAGDVAGERGDH
jgi:DNA-binding response OmpR family regulator